jgi:oligopeptide/dipeptide ABC transporter ATP-binding protein
MDELLRVESLVKHFPLEKGQFIAAVNDVAFSIGRGETLGLVGESGSGKTTVGRCVLRLIEPTGGRIEFDGKDITTLDVQRLRRLRHRMQLVFQEPFASLNPRRTVRQTVEEPLVLEGHLGASERGARIREIADLVHLSERQLGRYPSQLTASEQQRVGIARAIVTHPDLIVLDEPTSTLDQSVRAEILDVLIDLQEEFGTSYLFISHDLTAVERVSHRIAIMYLGRIVEVGTADQIFGRQYHPYSRALLSAVLYPDPRRKLEPFLLEGEIPSAINPEDECPLYGRCPIGLPSCTAAFPPYEEVEPGHRTACYRWQDFVAGTAEPIAGRAQRDGDPAVGAGASGREAEM